MTNRWILLISYLTCESSSCNMFRRKKSCDKKLLEHKLYLARESPELTFDISGCGLTEIPSNIYSLCNVFLKESLVLCHNHLQSLSGGGNLKDLGNLKILNLAHNEFECLPADVGLLANLQELYLEHNKLKTLPDSLCKLVNLKTLTLSHNKLKHLPEDIGLLKSLHTLNIEENPVTKLPKSFYKLSQLTVLHLNCDQFCYPPSEVVKNGIEAIIKYICADVGVEFDYNNKNGGNQDLPEPVPETDQFQEQICELEQKKLKKAQEFLEMERNNELLKQQEIEMANAHKLNKKQLLDQISLGQSNLDQKIGKFQLKRESERFRLIEQLQEAENNANVAINSLLTLNREPAARLLEKEEEEKTKLMATVDKFNDKDLRKTDILVAMQDILKQESDLFNKYSSDKQNESRSILEQEAQSDVKLSEILHNQDEQKSNLIQQLTVDSDLQKAAVSTLLERGDLRSWGLVQQVRLVESQLAGLTNIELDRKKLKTDRHINDLAEKRLRLSMLLMDLLEQQQIRRTQLISTIQALEERNTKDVEDFWLRQYQSLLQKLPEGLSQAQKNLDPKLAEALLINGVLHCVPFLAKLTQSKTITDADLLDAGITSATERQKILDSLYVASNKEGISCDHSDHSPSAPLMEETAPSAPPALTDNINAITTVECVICLDSQCQVIFVPCGHFCCCSNCSLPIAQCPLCRTDVQKRITMDVR